MPIKTCQKDGKPGFKFGDQGKCFIYSDNESKERARRKATEQGQAIKASQSAKDSSHHFKDN